MSSLPGRSLPWGAYLSATAAAIALKLHYSRASAEALGWILAPTARVVAALYGEPLDFDPASGWVARDGAFHIAPACAGVNFLVVLFAVTVFGFVHRRHGRPARAAWVVASLAAAWLLTILVNALRIVLVVHLHQAEIGAGVLGPERIHRMAGTLVYVIALWCLWRLLDRASPPDRRAPARSGAGRTALVPGAAYVGMTVLLPLANGAWRESGTRFLEHGLSVTALAVVTLLLLQALFPRRRGAAAGPDGVCSGDAREVGGGNGQADDPRSRR